MINKKILAVVTITTALSLQAQVSVFDAGNLNTHSPYGLTESEKELLKNKRDVANLESNLNTFDEQMQGLQSLIEGISQRLVKLEQRVGDLEAMVGGQTSENTTSISSLKAYVEETRAIQDKNYKNITKTLKDLSALIDKKSNVSTQNTTTKQSTNSSSKVDLNKKNNAEVFNDAVKLFNANKNEEAKEYFSHLVKKNSRPAASNYYLGEIAYKEKSYASAIKHYQKSIEIDDKGSYLPKLLYHTAISFDKIGDTASANRFYKALKAGYPNSKEAQASPNRN